MMQQQQYTYPTYLGLYLQGNAKVVLLWTCCGAAFHVSVCTQLCLAYGDNPHTRSLSTLLTVTTTITSLTPTYSSHSPLLPTPSPHLP